MGLFDFLTGNRDPDPDVPKLSRDELYDRLLALRDPEGTWHVRPAEDEGRADLVAAWGPVDQRFVSLFGASGKRASKRVLMRLVPEEHMVRSVDHDGTFSWGADLTGMRFEASVQRGQSRDLGGSWTIGRKDDGSIGTLSSRQWDTDDIKKPLRETVAEAGWGWHGVAFERL